MTMSKLNPTTNSNNSNNNSNNPNNNPSSRSRELTDEQVKNLSILLEDERPLYGFIDGDEKIIEMDWFDNVVEALERARDLAGSDDEGICLQEINIFRYVGWIRPVTRQDGTRQNDIYGEELGKASHEQTMFNF